MVGNGFRLVHWGVIAFAGTVMGSPAERAAQAASKPIGIKYDHKLDVGVTPEDYEAISGWNVVAGVPPGDQVYNNVSASPSIYLPGRNQRMADDLTLASGPCQVVYYELAVAGGVHPSLPNLPFNVTVELWNGDPCDPGSSAIPGTLETFTSIPADQGVRLLQVTLDTPVSTPGTVWMAVTFSENDAGWIVAGQAEVGTTQNFWSENDTSAGCGLFQFGGANPPHAGLWATINCSLASDPMGACCNLSTCTQTTQAQCITGVWQGPFTTCVPNVCQAGTCCTGLTFDECTSANEATCVDGVFTPNATCAAGCPPNFKVFENDFRTGLFIGVLDNTKFGDDMTFAPGAPCDLLAYDLTVFGDPDGGPPTFDVIMALWTNDDRGTPTTPEDDLPLAPIPGTERTYTGIPADFSGHRLLASGFTGIVLPEKAWLVVDTSSPNGGPGLGGIADIGESLDAFAIFNPPDPPAPNAWVGGFWFEGFNPNTCPGGLECVPAGSFRSDVWCAGNPPTGACCDRFAGVCTEGVTFENCSGRWVEGGTCAPETFDPPCGQHACCERFELNPNATICVNRTPEDCATRHDGFLSRGRFCDDFGGQCPAGMCMGHEGDCLTEHAGIGCEDPFCTCAVCNTTSGAFCCQVTWDEFCALDAEALCTDLENNDLCSSPKQITGVGTFPFDNTEAGTDGPAHAACISETGNNIVKDVWFKWKATCTNRVFVSTCDQTFVDSKIAVYQGTTCPPTDAMLAGCNDDRCLLQSLVIFDAVLNQDYLIRIGSAPSQGAGAGTFRISCGPPPNGACPATGDCCAATGGPACADANCCRTVCACDPFCCTTDWDEACASIGFEGSGCGAAVMCINTCAGGCPPGPVEDVSPPNGVVDAGRPHNSITGMPLEGINEILLVAPTDASASCFDFCETAAIGAANNIASMVDMAGLYELMLLRPMTPGAASTVSYSNVLGGTVSGVYTSHPGNANGDGFANASDVSALVNALAGTATLPWGSFSYDIDRSGRFTPLDLWEEINVLNGGGAQEIWDGSPLPGFSGICP
jgi:hypothetical protein